MRRTFLRLAAALLTAHAYLLLQLGGCGGGDIGAASILSRSSALAAPPSYTLVQPEFDGAGYAFGATPFLSTVSSQGEARVSIPLVTPEGRAGLEPSLSLEYSS